MQFNLCARVPFQRIENECNNISYAIYTWLPMSYHLMSLLFKALRLWEWSSLVKKLASGIPASCLQPCSKNHDEIISMTTNQNQNLDQINNYLFGAKSNSRQLLRTNK